MGPPADVVGLGSHSVGLVKFGLAINHIVPCHLKCQWVDQCQTIGSMHFQISIHTSAAGNMAQSMVSTKLTPRCSTGLKQAKCHLEVQFSA